MQEIGAKVMFIEVNNEDERFLAKQYRSTVRYSIDYAGLNDASSVCLF
jgi:ribosome biogenesis SPOUT family RNA methylase Rps3